MNLESIAKEIQRAGLATMKTDLFIENIPAAVKEGVLLRGDFFGTPINHELPGYRKTEFQVIVRTANYKVGKKKAEDISILLTFDNRDLTGMAMKYIRPIHEPVAYPLSPGDLLEFSVNFEAAYVIVPE